MTEGNQVNEVSIESLAVRVASIERRVGNLRRAAVGLLMAMVAIGIATVAWSRLVVPQTIRARGFSLVDGSGNVVAQLARASGGPVLVLESKDASTKLLFGVIQETPSLALLVGDRVRAELTVGPEGAPSLNLRDAEGRARVSAAVDEENRPLLALWNEEGRLDFVLRPGHEPIMQVFGPSGVPLLAVKNPTIVKPESTGAGQGADAKSLRR